MSWSCFVYSRKRSVLTQLALWTSLEQDSASGFLFLCVFRSEWGLLPKLPSACDTRVFCDNMWRLPWLPLHDHLYCGPCPLSFALHLAGELPFHKVLGAELIASCVGLNDA